MSLKELEGHKEITYKSSYIRVISNTDELIKVLKDYQKEYGICE
jgi:hypothetical protein